MKTAEFNYDYPPELIAQVPLEQRTSARLLVLDRSGDGSQHTRFDKLHEFLRAGDLLVLNDTRVMKCRLRGRRASTGGKVELLLLEPLADGSYVAIGQPSKRLAVGTRLEFGEGQLLGEVLRNERGRLVVSLASPDGEEMDECLRRVAEMPLPPYIRRDGGPTELDETMYQTVYSETPGAVAAPTAGLHFDADYLAVLQQFGVRFTHVTVHTGLGSFRPIRTENIEEHEVPAEEFVIGSEVADEMNTARSEGRRIVAVGTSCVRALETSVEDGKVIAQHGKTTLYIRPGHEFRAIDCMLTNFHQPCSSLIVLVCAFAGREKVLAAYREAVALRYRLFSYGDAMLIA